MLQVIKCVGSNVGVIDTDDGVIEWISKKQALDYFNSGVEIVGLSASGIKASPISLPMNLCNWVKGANLFKSMKHYSFNNNQGLFLIKDTYNKDYKGRFKIAPDGSIALEFSFGVRTVVPRSCFSK